MRLAWGTVAAELLLLASTASAAFMRGTGGLQIGPEDGTAFAYSLAAAGNGTSGYGTFNQLINHSTPSLGTFKQRFWYGTQYWKGPGSPIILVNPGEQSGAGFNRSFTGNTRLPGLFAEKVGGAVVILEHRYWGESSPFQELTTENMQYLTLENSILDNVYFAEKFAPPFDKSGRSSPDKAPWIFTGGSYPGALAGWIAALSPGTFWAYHGTSGVVEAIGDFWAYFDPVLEATPKNCTADVTAVIDYIDDVLLNGEEAEKTKLKEKFMFEELEDADFAAALVNGPWSWQSTQFYSVPVQGYNPYYQFCDYVENVFPESNSTIPGPGGVGREKALEGYAKWVREMLIPGYCQTAGYEEWRGRFSVGCFANTDPYNPAYRDLKLDNWINRQWNWMLCNEPFKYWQDGAPKGRPSLVSRLVNEEYWESQCRLFFPEGHYGIIEGKTEADVNAYTGGWSVENTTRLMYANGELDPWRDATVSSRQRPGGPLQSTPDLPVREIPGGIHCSDYYKPNWDYNEDAKKIAYEQADNVKKWVNEFYDTL